MIRLAVRCRAELADHVLGELLELVPEGVEEERGADWAEFAIYGPPGEVPAVPELEAATGQGLVEISATEVPDDWADRWRDFHQPVWIGERMVVRPSWLAAPETAAEIEVIVDPGQAFGTGAHATTRICLELLLELAEAGEADGSLADLGTGSGVLAIAAAKLGWGPVLGCDSEPAALEAAAANARANRVALELRRANLREDDPPRAATIVANLTAPLLEQVARRLEGPPRRVICSGLLSSEVGAVHAAFERRGLSLAGERVNGDWSALHLDGPSVAGRG